MDYNLLSGADLAFIGDAYFELYIRNYVLHKGVTKLNKLHNECVKYVSRDSQYKIISNLINELSEEELNIFKRGRNYDYKTKTVEYIYNEEYKSNVSSFEHEAISNSFNRNYLNN